MVGAVVATREEQALRRGGRSMRFARESDRHQRPRRQRRLGERRNGASRARSASGRLVRTLSAPTATASPSRDHKNESMQAFRFKTVVGPGSHDRRFLGHACSTLPALYRTHGPSQEHGALLCALDRTDLVRHFLPDPPMGPHRFERTINRTSLRRGKGGRRHVSQSPMPETGPRLQSEDDQASAHRLTSATVGAAPAGWMQGRAELSIYTRNGIGARLAGRSGEPGLAMRQAPPSEGRLLTPQILRQFIDPDIEFGNRYFQAPPLFRGAPRGPSSF